MRIDSQLPYYQQANAALHLVQARRTLLAVYPQRVHSVMSLIKPSMTHSLRQLFDTYVLQKESPLTRFERICREQHMDLRDGIPPLATDSLPEPTLGGSERLDNGLRGYAVDASNLPSGMATQSDADETSHMLGSLIPEHRRLQVDKRIERNGSLT